MRKNKKQNKEESKKHDVLGIHYDELSQEEKQISTPIVTNYYYKHR